MRSQLSSLTIPLQALGLFVAGVLAAPAAAQLPSSCPVAWWPGEGDAVDIINGNGGTLGGGATFAPGMVGQGFSLDGVSGSVIQIPDSPDLRPQMLTAEAWVKTNSYATQSILAKPVGPSHYNSFQLWTANGRLGMAFKTTVPSVSLVAPITLGQFFHAAMTWDGSTARLYLNGALVHSTMPAPSMIDYDNSPVVIGSDLSFGNLELAVNGVIDEPAIWDRALSQAEIHAIYAAGSAGKPSCVTDSPPIADAGVDFPVNEGQTSVMLDGSASSDPDSDPLSFSWIQSAGTIVVLSDATAAQPTFDAPLVPIGGEMLTFELTITANGVDDTDTVDVSVVNVNHTPVAEAGPDQSLANNTAVAEGSPVTLDGGGSFDIDNDSFTYAWTQDSGPTVLLSGATTASPTFTAPVVGGSGAPGVVATLVFRLTVDDLFSPDCPAPGYTLADCVDTVIIEITNINNDPIADAAVGPGPNELMANENSLVTLDGTDSSDPDSDTLTYAWQWVSGPAVTLLAANTATPSFTAPFVSAGGSDVEFSLTVDDGYGGMHTNNVVVHVQNINDPPLASAARPTKALLWPPKHGMVLIGILGVTDPDNDAVITIDSVTQDEPTNGQGDGDTAIDAIINPDGTVLVRAERSGNGDGRVYHIHFTASDLEGSASGVVTVSVPKKKKSTAVDSGQAHDSTN